MKILMGLIVFLIALFMITKDIWIKMGQNAQTNAYHMNMLIRIYNAKNATLQCQIA